MDRRLKTLNMAADVIVRTWAAVIALGFAWILFTAPHATTTRLFFGSFIVAVVYSAMFRPVPRPTGDA